VENIIEELKKEKKDMKDKVGENEEREFENVVKVIRKRKKDDIM
jgi:hypothetical protein